MINSCLSACNRHGIDHYRLKANENKIDCTDDSESNNELECEENDVILMNNTINTIK